MYHLASQGSVRTHYLWQKHRPSSLRSVIQLVLHLALLSVAPILLKYSIFEIHWTLIAWPAASQLFHLLTLVAVAAAAFVAPSVAAVAAAAAEVVVCRLFCVNANEFSNF